MFLRDTYNESYIGDTMSIFGIFENRNRDTAEFVNENGITVGGAAHIKKRRMYAEEITRDGVKYYKYHLVVPINHGLARQEKPLPAGLFIICL